MSLELIGKFIGTDEIVSSEKAEFNTPRGGEVVRVTFKNGRKRIFPAKTLDIIVTEQASDPTVVRDKTVRQLVLGTLALLAEYDLKDGDLETYIRELMKQVDLNFQRAASYLWFKTDSEFVAGYDSRNDLSLLMAHEVITSIPDKAIEPILEREGKKENE